MEAAQIISKCRTVGVVGTTVCMYTYSICVYLWYRYMYGCLGGVDACTHERTAHAASTHAPDCVTGCCTTCSFLR
jgi:hypothetical protein